MAALLDLRSRDLEEIAATVDLMSKFARRTGETQDRIFEHQHALARGSTTVDLTWSEKPGRPENGGYRIRRIAPTPQTPKEA